MSGRLSTSPGRKATVRSRQEEGLVAAEQVGTFVRRHVTQGCAGMSPHEAQPVGKRVRDVGSAPGRHDRDIISRESSMGTAEAVPPSKTIAARDQWPEASTDYAARLRFFRSAQRSFIISEMRLRAAALMRRRPRLLAEAVPGGRPRRAPRRESRASRASIARSSRSRSVRSWSRIRFVSMIPRPT